MAGSEFEPRAIRAVADQILERIEGSQFSGIIGGPDQGHQWGYHRSRNRLIQIGHQDSSMAHERDQGGDGDAVSALDIKMPLGQMIAVTSRLKEAADAEDGRLTDVVSQFAGTLDGGAVYAWDVGSHRRQTGWDNTHLWHVHISFWRDTCTEEAALLRFADLFIGDGAASPISTQVEGRVTPIGQASDVGWLPFDGVNFNLAEGHFYGLASGPATSHGGAPGFEQERAPIAMIQRRLQELGYAPADPGWADGIFEQPTADAVAAWQRDHMPGTQFFGEVWGDDWAALFAASPAAPAAPVEPVPAAAVEAWGAPPYPFGGEDRFGLITGPAQLHGGDPEFDGAEVIQCITLIQQRLQFLGYAAADIGWTSGRYEQSTCDAVAAWQSRNMVGVTEFPGEVWSDDYAKLFSADNVRA